MDFTAISIELLAGLGGVDNVVTNEACMTRLRVGVRDVSRVDVEAIKSIDGVMGVVQSDTLQVVFGPGIVNKVLDAFASLTGIPKGGLGSEVVAVARKNKEDQAYKHGNPLQRFLKRVANIFVPLLPGIIAAGLINGIANVINVSAGEALGGTWWYETIRTMGWALFAYLPIFVGYNAAREFGGTPILGGIAGAVCVSNPSMPLLATYGDAQLLLPLTHAPYNPGSGGLVAALLAGALFAWLERKLHAHMPCLVDTFVTPLCVLAIGSLVLVVALQPVGAVLTEGVYVVMQFVYEKMGIVGGYVLAAGFLPLVSVGLHQALTPIHVMLNDPAGPTMGVNFLLPILMMAGGGQVGAGLALYLRSKSQKLKGYIRDSIPVGVLGVGEPLMYAVTLPLGRPFVTACLGAGVGGMLATLFHLGAISQGVSGLFGALIIQSGQQVAYVVSLLGACVGGFVLTWLFGVDDERIEELYGE
jgi:PTS system sucrose-specific IIC component